MERWRQIESLFAEALRLPPAERAGFLRQSCGGDSGLLREVQSLVANHREENESIEWAAAAAAQLISAPARLEPGQSLGPYWIVSFIAEGGMGAVYRAHDPRMGREVAIKVAGARFSERFSREVRAVAALNHPNICHVYDVGPNYLVMELVEGQSPRGPMPLEMALDFARQIANALEEAHEKGIVHRDLKPGNIRITPDGTVKVLDFGLAKVSGVAAQDENSPTLSVGPTQSGLILGTAAYMSPEQARGKVVDKRADIWAFGVVLFEMLSGKRLFEGETVSDTVAQVLTSDPDWNQVPWKVRRLLKACLEKDVKNRLQAISDWQLLLESFDGEPGAATAPSRSRLVWALGGILCVTAAVGFWGWLRSAPPEPRTVMRVATTLPVTVGGGPGVVGAPVLSHDGSRLAFAGGPTQQIYVRMMDQLESRPLPGTEGAGFLCFSPDGQWISYVADGHLRKIAVAGGPPQTLAEALTVVGPPTQNWGPDDNILFSNKGVLMRIPSGGGTPATVATPDAAKGERYYAAAQLLPGSRQILVSISAGSNTPVAPPKVLALNPETGERKTLLENVDLAQYVPMKAGSAVGYLVYVDAGSGSLMAVPFDAKRLEVRGSAVPVVDGIRFLIGPFGAFGVSDSGTLAYVPGGSAAVNLFARTLVWVDRKGSEQPLSFSPRNFTDVRMSPDGARVALTIATYHGMAIATADIWVYDIARGGMSRITQEGANITPLWMPDGKRLIYASGVSVLRVMPVSGPADGMSPPVPLTNDGIPRLPFSISPDGKLVIGRIATYTGMPNNFWVLSVADDASGTPKPRSFLDSRSAKMSAEFSPDSRWVAYQSLESGRYEVYVVNYPDADQKFTISTDGGTTPRWSRNGRELFYKNGNKMLAVDIHTTPTFRAGVPRILFGGSYTGPYAVAPDGKRFLMLKPPAVQETPADQLVLVMNWLQELRRRVPMN